METIPKISKKRRNWNNENSYEFHKQTHSLHQRMNPIPKSKWNMQIKKDGDVILWVRSYVFRISNLQINFINQKSIERIAYSNLKLILAMLYLFSMAVSFLWHRTMHTVKLKYLNI